MDESKNLHRDLYCVLFPGIVKNDEKAIECMGGLKGISQCYSQSNKKRLGMSFQPENPYIRRMYADSKPTAGVLLSLKVKKTRTGSEIKREVVSTSIVGSVKKINKFESMCDYQYLPVTTPVSKSNTPQCFLEQILPSGVDQLNFMEDVEEYNYYSITKEPLKLHSKYVEKGAKMRLKSGLHDKTPKANSGIKGTMSKICQKECLALMRGKLPAPMFITPSSFARLDKPISYFYTEKRNIKPSIKDESMNVDEDVHKSRVDRGLPIPRYTFNLSEDLPLEPHEYYLKKKDTRESIYPLLKDEFETIKKLFDERPVWSLNLIKYHTKIKINSLKVIVPCLAIYMKEGPWRMMWVRYGYDPRKEPGARIYQTLDFRMRHAAGVHSMVMTRDQVVHCKKTDRIRHFKKDASEPLTPEDIVYEGAVYFRPGMVPSQRQVYYQYCDVQLPEVQELLALEPPAGYLCHARRGWLPPDTDQLCRDHIFRSAKQTLLDMYKADLKFEEGSLSGSDSEEDASGANASVNDVDESMNIL